MLYKLLRVEIRAQQMYEKINYQYLIILVQKLIMCARGKIMRVYNLNLRAKAISLFAAT